MRMLALSIPVALATLAKPADAEACRLALVLALDVSGSVNETEYTQQLSGVAYALNSPSVRASILNGAKAPVHLAVFEWSSRNHQFLVQPWITLDSHAAIDRAVAGILGYQKKRAGLKTALSTAMLFAADLLQSKADCWQKKIDVSGDGKNNIGPPLAQVYALKSFADVTVNALVIGDPSPAGASEPSSGLTKSSIRNYYQREVILGPDSFAMIAHGYEDYARAMQEKLIRELKVPVLGAVE